MNYNKRKNWWFIMIEKVTFLGAKHLGIKALKIINMLASENLISIITIDDSKEKRCKLNEFKEFSQQTGKKLHILKKPSELNKVIDEDEPELVIVVGWYWVLKENLLKKVPKGFIGIHSSLLPKYRGGAPLIWPIINGDSESGISLFHLDNGMDTGDIIAQKRFNIGNENTIKEILEKVESLIAEVLEENYPLLLNETAPRIPQNDHEATYCSQRKPEDGKIDWNKSNIEIHNLIRAQNHPYPGAFCYTEIGKKMFIWKSSLFPKKYYGIPGLVAQTFNDHVLVTCGEGAICLYNIQIESENEVNAAQILKFGLKLK